MNDELRAAFELPLRRSIDVNDYVGAERDLAFDLVTVDSLVAGILSRLLDGGSTTTAENTVLGRQFLSGKVWNGHEVRNVDLSRNEQMLLYAEAIEQARASCHKLLREGRR